MDLSSGSVSRIYKGTLASEEEGRPPPILEVLEVKKFRSANSDVGEVVCVLLSDGDHWMPVMLDRGQHFKVDQIKERTLIVLNEFTLNHVTRQGKRGRMVKARTVSLTDGVGRGGDGVRSVAKAVAASALFRPVPRPPLFQVPWEDVEPTTGLHALSGSWIH